MFRIVFTVKYCVHGFWYQNRRHVYIFEYIKIKLKKIFISMTTDSDELRNNTLLRRVSD